MAENIELQTALNRRVFGGIRNQIFMKDSMCRFTRTTQRKVARKVLSRKALGELLQARCFQWRATFKTFFYLGLGDVVKVQIKLSGSKTEINMLALAFMDSH